MFEFKNVDISSIVSSSLAVSIGSLIYLAKEHGVEIVKQSYSVNPDNIFEKLRKVRLKIARSENKPAFMIFSNRTLNQLVKENPQSKKELIEIKGIGRKKVKDYGDSILEVTHK